MRTNVGLIHLLGVLPPANATAAARDFKASWSAKKITDLTSIKGEPLRAEFVRPSESVLCMRGIFSRDTPLKIQEIADPAAIKTLVITCDGGWTEPAIDLGKLAERHRWLVVVDDKCFSSCANYVFLSRTEKVVLPRSLLGWHGLPKDPSEFDVGVFEKEKARLPPGSEWANIDADTVLSSWGHSKDFLAEHNIPPELCRARPQDGHSKDYVARLNSLGRSGANPSWTYGKEALEKKIQCDGHSLHVGAGHARGGHRFRTQKIRYEPFLF